MHPTAVSIVIFGVTGDLAKRKLFPAIASLYKKCAIPNLDFQLIGYGRKPLSQEGFAHLVQDSVGETPEGFLASCHYIQGELTDPEGFTRLKEQVLTTTEPQDVLFYFAVAPEFHAQIAQQLATAGLNQEKDGFEPCIVIEKPFGHDVASAHHLHSELRQYFKDNQMYRIDHYLGKPAYQQALLLRAQTDLLNRYWNSSTIASVDILIAESLGVEGRGAYYDKTGALSDMLQSHGLQLAALMAMQTPTPDLHTSVQLRETALTHLTPTRLRTSQYQGYTDELNVDSNSTTDTYAELQLKTTNGPLADVPITLRTGKKLGKKETVITLTLRQPLSIPFVISNATKFVIHLEPELQFSAITNDRGVILPVKIPTLPAYTLTDPHERLLSDCLINQHDFFVSEKEIEASWKIIEAAKAGEHIRLQNYQPETPPFLPVH